MTESQISLVRSAVNALYVAQDGATRKAADHWLQNFRNSAGAWQLCVALLARPGLADYEYHFAAHSLRLACSKVPEILDPTVLQGLAAQIASLLLSSVNAGAWPVAGQLSSALAALTVRATCWEEEALVPHLLSLLAPQVATAMLADLALGHAAAGAPGGAGSPVVTAAVAAEAGAVYALLQVVSNLPEACTSRAVCAHTQRKAVVAAALASDAMVAPLLRAAVVGSRNLGAGAAGAQAGAASSGAALRRAGLQLLRAWAEQLGTAPRALEHEVELVSCLYESLVTSDTAALAAECLCGLINNCVPRRDGDGGENSLSGYHSDSSSSSSMLLLSDAPPGGGVPPGFNGWRRGGGTVGTTVGTTGSATIASNWSEAGFRRSRGMGGGPGGAPSRGSSGAHQRIASPLATAAAAAAGHSSGNGMLGMAGLAAGAGLSVQGVLALSPERQLAATLLLQRLLDGLQGLLQSAAVVYRQQYQAGLVSPQPGVAPDSDTAFWCLWTDGAVLQAICSVLCAAASAVLPPALRGDVALQGRFAVLWPQLMALLGHSNPEVALACVSFWQDTYLAQLLQSCAPPPAAGAQQTALQAHIAAQQAAQRLAMLQGHLPLLGQLLAGLVSRAALGTEAAATATADARDLPEEVRMVRRELGATMRDLVDLVGLGHVAAFLERMISEHALQLGAAATAAAASSSNSTATSAAHSTVHSAAQSIATSAANSNANSVEVVPVGPGEEVRIGDATVAVAGGKPGTPPATGPGGLVVWTRLESSLYAANVALCSGGGLAGAIRPPPNDNSTGSAGSTSTLASPPGPHVPPHTHHQGQPAPRAAAAAAAAAAAVNGPPVDDAHVASIINAAAAAVVHPASSLKLAGTALTLVGGMAPWFALHPEVLARPLDALRAALRSPNEKLARNAATALNRLCVHRGCAALLLGRYSGWVASLLELLPGPGVTLRHKPAPGVDMTSRELLIASLMRLACNGAASPGATGNNAGADASGAGTDSEGNVAMGEQSAAGGDAAAASGSELSPRELLRQLLAPRVQAAIEELDRLAGMLRDAVSSGALTTHLEHWRGSRRQLQVQLQQQQLQQLQQLQQQRHGPPPPPPPPPPAMPLGCPFTPADAVNARAPLCRAAAPGELQQLGAVATVAAQRVGGLASMLMFIPAAGQVQDMGGGGHSRVIRSAHEALLASAPPDGDAAAVVVASLVVQMVRTVWPHLAGCLQGARPGAEQGKDGATSGAAADGASAAPDEQQQQEQQAAEQRAVLLETLEGAHLLPAACSLLQGSLLVAAAAGHVLSTGAADLLSSANTVLGVSHGAPPIPPTEQQVAAVLWPANLDWSEAGPAAQGNTSGVAGRIGAAAGALYLQQQRQMLALQPGPPLCVLQLVLGCLPVCGDLITLRQAAQVQQQHAQQHQQLQQLQQQLQQLQGKQAAHQPQPEPDARSMQQLLEGSAVAERSVQEACTVAKEACLSLLAPRSLPGRSHASAALAPDPERILAVLPVLQSLLLNAPQGLAASRELLEVVVATTVSCMHCSDPEACRALLDWTALLLGTTGFAPQLGGTGPSPASTALAAAAIGSSIGAAGPGAGAGAAGGAKGAPGNPGGGRGHSTGLAALFARCRVSPALEAAYAEIASQLDRPVQCCPPNAIGLVYSQTVAESGVLGPAAAAAAAAAAANAVAARAAGAGPGSGTSTAGNSASSDLVSLQAQLQAQAHLQAQMQMQAQLQAQATAAAQAQALGLQGLGGAGGIPSLGMLGGAGGMMGLGTFGGMGGMGQQQQQMLMMHGGRLTSINVNTLGGGMNVSGLGGGMNVNAMGGLVGGGGRQPGMFGMLGMPAPAPPAPPPPLQPVVGCLGSVLVLSLMVAASVGMPPDLMLPISNCLHSGWLAMGGARFRTWLRSAAVELSAPPGGHAPMAAMGAGMGGMGGMGGVGGMGGAGMMGMVGGSGPFSVGGGLPWARLTSDLLALSLTELWGDDCERDVVKFKRALKTLCGGKKRGTGPY
ncbi:hypothetical protein CHLRE_13g586750v5 [Chlamydomonas reinhardtii]|uniref:Uncharacterized protein n=1 Tax=Chlamydomonas reinhardtii TaxID=3055 RepID=A0A2K3D0R5_CHLRE|nr:uncharacterized protein CHLRE_13g586750v5 [Chlamydomonas reinhardtii]PNW74135.1 hypothetical protein CHLRE_13g586750v5 [Chlamydomonas reinhardtii]